MSDAATVYLLYEKAGKKAPSPAEPFPPFLLACVLQTRREQSPAGAMSESGSASAAAATTTILNGGSAARHPGNLVTVVLGAQWGDEGKGKVVDLLAQDADIVCRCQVRAPIGRRGGLVVTLSLLEAKPLPAQDKGGSGGIQRHLWSLSRLNCERGCRALGRLIAPLHLLPASGAFLSSARPAFLNNGGFPATFTQIALVPVAAIFRYPEVFPGRRCRARVPIFPSPPTTLLYDGTGIAATSSSFGFSLSASPLRPFPAWGGLRDGFAARQSPLSLVPAVQ